MNLPDYEQEQLAFKALADPTRRAILQLMSTSVEPMMMSDIVSEIKKLSQSSMLVNDITRQGVAKHIKILKHAQLIRIDESGRERLCQLDTEGMKIVEKWLQYYQKFWSSAASKLEDYLDST